MDCRANRESIVGSREGNGLAPAWAHLAGTRQWGERKAPDPPVTPRERASLIRAAAEARTSLREAALAAAEAAARARSVADALDEALAALRDMETAPASAAPSWTGFSRQVDRLSPREQEVLALVAEGRSNKSIAEALYVSPNTIKTHVASLLSKLHAGTRVELAAIAARQQMR